MFRNNRVTANLATAEMRVLEVEVSEKIERSRHVVLINHGKDLGFSSTVR